jgi:hypothetical protein
MHDGFKFHFARRTDYYYFLGAVTHQAVVPTSEFRFRHCKIRSKFQFTRRDTKWEACEGHLHVLRELEDDEYQEAYMDEHTGGLPIVLPRSFDDRSSEGSSDTRMKTHTALESKYVKYRLVLYLKDCNNEASNRKIALISLNHNGFRAEFNHSEKRMSLLRRNGVDIWGTILHAPGSGSTSDPKLAGYPGIPLDPHAITKSIKESHGFDFVELTFWHKRGTFISSII